MQIKTILVPSDFSDYAEYAFTWALEMAEKWGAKVVVINAAPLFSHLAYPESVYMVALATPFNHTAHSLGGARAMPKEAKVHFLRRALLTGLLILLPLFITYVLIAFLFHLFTGVGGSLRRRTAAPPWPRPLRVAGPLVPLVNLLLSLVVIFVLGLVGTNLLGRRLLAAFEALLLRLPLVKTIYSAVKQMVDNFQGPRRSFQRVVLLQYPRTGVWSVGFVAAERGDNLPLSVSTSLLTVFIPTTPNPTSGFLVLVTPDEVVDIDYSLEDAFKFIISSGIVGKDFTPAQHEAVATSAAETGFPKTI